MLASLFFSVFLKIHEDVGYNTLSVGVFHIHNNIEQFRSMKWRQPTNDQVIRKCDTNAFASSKFLKNCEDLRYEITRPIKLDSSLLFSHIFQDI